MIEKLDLKNGKIIYNTFHVNLDIPLENQICELREDLLQIKYGNEYLVDVGFDSELDPDGFFKVVVIKDSDWFKPLLSKRVKKEQFLSALQECIDFAAELQKRSV